MYKLVVAAPTCKAVNNEKRNLILVLCQAELSRRCHSHHTGTYQARPEQGALQGWPGVPIGCQSPVILTQVTGDSAVT